MFIAGIKSYFCKKLKSRFGNSPSECGRVVGQCIDSDERPAGGCGLKFVNVSFDISLKGDIFYFCGESEPSVDFLLRFAFWLKLESILNGGQYCLVICNGGSGRVNKPRSCLHGRYLGNTNSSVLSLLQFCHFMNAHDCFEFVEKSFLVCLAL